MIEFAHIFGTFWLVFPPVSKPDEWVLDQHVLGDAAIGDMNPKMYTLLQVYDEFTEITRGWSRE